MTVDIQNKAATDEIHEVSRLYRDYLNPDLARLIKFSGLGTIEERASGSLVYDYKGRDYLDFSGGYGVFSLGHSHPRVVAAVQEQLEAMALSPRVFLNRQQARLAERLAQLSPGKLQYSFFCNSGTEGVEGALKLARAATGRSHFVSATNSYHGKTMGSLSVSGRDNYKAPFEPLVPGTRQVPWGDLEALDLALDQDVAAVILEPVQGEGGIHLPPDGYLQGAADRARRHGALFIADEVQSGLGRTGRLFAVEHWGVEPDIMVLAKALGGGVMPIGAYLATPEVAAAYRGKPLLHTSTFGGNPLACAAALATLEVLVEEQLSQRAAEAGQAIMASLTRLQKEFPNLIKEVRGLGLMIGLELLEDRFGGSIISEMAKRRVVAVYTLNQPRVIRFEPPLNVEHGEIDRAMQALQEAMVETARRMGG
ncbi:MAG: aspartate aminotransferase family protein [Vulcanimicrobiota bacterium]